MMSMLRCCASRITLPTQTKIICRKYMTISEKMELLLKQKDHISRDYKIIYRDKNHMFVGFMYHALNFMSYMTVGALGYLWYNDIPIQENAKHFTLNKNAIETLTICIAIVSIFYTSYWIQKRFVLRVYFSERAQKYKAIFIGRVPFTCEHREFPAKSLIFASKNSAFPWQQTVLKSKDRKIYLFEDNFRTHSDFLNMLKPGEAE